MSESPRPTRVRSKSIEGLLDRLPTAHVHGAGSTLVTGITHDSRAVRPGDVYLARAGAHTHGIAHVEQAVGAGAVAVLTDPPSVEAALAAGAATVVEVEDPQAATGPAAAWVYDDPSLGMVVVGLTGTNGKTTTAYLVEAGLRAAGVVTGLIGTVETHIAGTVVASARTTPEATDLQALFASMRERGVGTVVMEVSSHALALDRVGGTTFEVAGFTNLSQDHLDFHPDMEHYFIAKRRLFTTALSRRAVVAVDDAWGRRLAAETTVPVVTVGATEADWRRTEESVDTSGGSLTLVSPTGERHRLDVALPGAFNLRNAALAFVVLVECGVDTEVARAGIASLPAVPGRMEPVDVGQPFAAIVDYAHTPDAVAALLDEARTLAAGGRVIVVLGCGGDRDAAKRPLMGAAAVRGADLAVLTSDNPRSEEPAAILSAMEAGARTADADAEILTELDRRAAIAVAVAAAEPGDVLVVAGKGHEQGQELADRTLPFDDRVVLREVLLAAAGSSR